MISLPIDAVLPDVVAAARRAPVVLRAETGAGKTTRVPPALLEGGIAGDRMVVMLEPRRVAARAAARRIAEERGWTVGGDVGWWIRHERKMSDRTRILVVTDGILLRMLQDDPELSRVGAVIVDELHERGILVDLALALLRQVRTDLRPDLGLVAMSATLDADPLAAWLGAEQVSSTGRAYPVEIRHDPLPDDGPLPDRMAAAIREALQNPGDVLAFLPGVREILHTADRLGTMDLRVLPLYGDLSPEEQDRVLRPGGGRKIVLATNVAETSLTVPGVRTVVDGGMARVLRQDPGTGLDRLVLERISRASADQRTGRAGREAPGWCRRLWTEREHRGLPAFTEPEIRRTDLAGPVLTLLEWGEASPADFPWYEPPPAVAVRHATELLADLRATDHGRLTPKGRQLAKLPLHPRAGAMLLEGVRLGAAREAALLAAILSDRIPPGGDGCRDVSELLRDPLPAHRRTAELLLRDVDARPTSGPAEALDRAVLAGWPDRVAKAREDRRRARLVGGRGVRVPGEIPCPAWFVCLDLEGSGAEATVRVTAPVDPSWLPTSEERIVELDPSTGRVVAVRRESYRDLVVKERPTDATRPEVEGALLAAASDRLADVQPSDREWSAFLDRVRFAAAYDPTLPSADDLLRQALPIAASGRRSFADLRSADWEAAARSVLGYATCRRLDELAPERITVPSGSAIRLDYSEGRPVLAVKIQELFGLAETPRIAGGKAPVLLHLLAPNGRPQQITEDLRGFWDRTWPEVRKELRARYPKHGWPEDPWTAQPRARPSRHRAE